ncbi:hypothetical protein [Natrialba sp. INN-245]|uniref:hypothetical protein n=1 Tax=Natrialba sp. INN-245 TaxID=2690967 RepID=UPI001313771A|nr:hypothetical protein [Natrialba sp. INN-245]MWV41048.1 hypothetical protein [Natrialba sp. INN-245]
MTYHSVGPRQIALLEAWADHIQSANSGPGFDLTDENRTHRTQGRAESFLGDPTENRFRELWSYETLADAVIGGPDIVLNQFEDAEHIAETIEEIRTATNYDPTWESTFPVDTAVWELYGRLHPESAPILYSECTRGLNDLGFSNPGSYAEAEETWQEFNCTYDEHVGHATLGTDHEVSHNHEMSEFLGFIATQDDETIEETLLNDEYRPIRGWREAWPVASDISLSEYESHLNGYAKAKQDGGLKWDGADDLWNKGHVEVWKDEYRKHVETVVKPKYDLTAIDSDEVEPLLDDLTESMSASSPVPAYMLGGRQGGILWSGFKKRSLEDPEVAASVLSYLFNDDDHVNLRLDRFGSFYGDLDDGGGQLLSLATILLTFVYPREYVLYRWGLMSTFFGDFADYNVRTGFNTDQYWKLNVACKRHLLADLDRRLDNPTMLDVHTIMYVYDRKYADGN